MRLLKHEHIAIVVRDIMIPVMGGIALCRQMKADLDYSHVPIILRAVRNSLQHSYPFFIPKEEDFRSWIKEEVRELLRELEPIPKKAEDTNPLIIWTDTAKMLGISLVTLTGKAWIASS